MQADRTSEWRNGWRPLAGAAIGIGTGYNLFLSTFGFLVVPMSAAFGVGRSALMLAPLVGVISSLLGPCAGLLVGRFGSQRLALAGLPLLAAVYLLIGCATALWQLYALAVMIGLLSMLTSPVVYCQVAAQWYRREAGLALSITMSGMSAVGMLAGPVVAVITERWGWRAGCVGLAALSLAVGLPVVRFWFRERYREDDRRLRGPAMWIGEVHRVVLRNPVFLRLAVAFGIAGLFIGGFISHIPAILSGKGFSAPAAGAMFSAYTGAALVSRLAAGWFLDRSRPQLVAAGFMAAAAAGAGLMAADAGQGGVLPTLTALILIGAGQGAEGDFLAFFALRCFGEAIFATIFGIFALIVGLGIAAGGYVFALGFDRFGSYFTVIAGAAALMCLAAALVGTMPLRDHAAA